eukprot:3590876-Amphidinium_carterae.5
MVHYYLGQDLLREPFARGTIGLMPAELPPHPRGHNPAVQQPPFFYDRAGRRGRAGRGDANLGKGKGNRRGDDDANPGKGKAPERVSNQGYEISGGKIGPQVGPRSSPAKFPAVYVPLSERDNPQQGTNPLPVANPPIARSPVIPSAASSSNQPPNTTPVSPSSALITAGGFKAPPPEVAVPEGAMVRRVTLTPAPQYATKVPYKGPPAGLYLQLTGQGGILTPIKPSSATPVTGSSSSHQAPTSDPVIDAANPFKKKNTRPANRIRTSGGNPDGTPPGDDDDAGGDFPVNLPEGPPGFVPMLPPRDEPMVNPLVIPGVNLEIDLDIIAEFLLPLHLAAHPRYYEPQHFFVGNLGTFTEDYPMLTPFSEALLLAYLRSLHIAQEAMCLSHVGYPYGTSHADHHRRFNRCVLVREQRKRIEHALSHVWNIAAGISYWSLTRDEQFLFDSMTTYLYVCWNVTPVSYNPESPPRYPLIPKRDP